MGRFSIRNFVIVIGLGILSIGAVNLWLPKSYVVRSEAILIRYNSEFSGDNSEHAKNRWVWVRDGLEITRRLKGLDLAQRILKDLGLDPEMGLKLVQEQMKISYTGGDENLWVFEIIHHEPELAKSISARYLQELERLGQEKIPQNERLLLKKAPTPQTEIILPPSIIGDVFSGKLKTLVFAIAILATIAGLIPVALDNWRSRMHGLAA